MKTTLKELGRGEVALTVEVGVDELAPYLDKAALELAEKTSIPGFRIGKVPLPVAKSRFGDMAILEAALDSIVAQTLGRALAEQSLKTFGQPGLSVEKIAPGNPVVYTATLALLPKVTIGDWRKIRVIRSQRPVVDADIDTVMKELQELQASEVLVDRPVHAGDKVELNFEVKRNGVVIEGGAGAKFPLIMGRQMMIPGFEEYVLGMRAGESKDFTLTFPANYFKKELAGAGADFHVGVLNVYERTLPEVNDAWAEKIVGKNVSALQAMIRGNLTEERRHEEQRRLENEILEQILAVTEIGDIPVRMRDAEIEKMLIELEEDVRTRGMQWDKYLQSIKKDVESLKKEFTPHAEKRVKGALIMKELAAELSVRTNDAEIDAEVSRQRERYAGNADAEKSLAQPEFRRYVGTILTNRRAMEELVKLLAS